MHEYATLFTWSTWLAAWIASARAQRLRRATWQPSCSLRLQLIFFYIKHPCHGQLTPVRSRYHVTISRARASPYLATL